MKKLPILLILVVLVIVGLLVIGKYLQGTSETPQPQEETSAYKIKDCGSSVSKKGGNSDNMDRNCFLEAYKTCTPAKLYQEVIDPDEHTIKTTVSVDTKEGDKCRVSVNVENKFKFPENEIYYCYQVSTTELNNYNIKIDECKDRKPLIL
ncbi:MAG TPA: hypothetical protein VG965_05360 [Patescibacteria group bacterium]|nr:hypothetical protein [Patescibacteria group bacterium]